jgi:hypothetical protein
VEAIKINPLEHLTVQRIFAIFALTKQRRHTMSDKVYFIVISENSRSSFPKYSTAKKAYDCLDETKAIYKVDTNNSYFTEDYEVSFLIGTDIFN